MDITTIADRMEIIDVLNRYAMACDSRDWVLFDQVFMPDVKSDYGGDFVFERREAVVGMIRSMLGGCGPTQHLLGNYRINVSGNTADSTCSVRAFHVGIGEAEGQTFEMWGEYHDQLVRSPDGWRITMRTLKTIWVQGSFEVLCPG